VHHNSRLKKSNEIQQYADIYLLINYSTCFGLPSRLSSGVYHIAVAASGTDSTIWGANFLRRDQIRTGVGPSVGFLQPKCRRFVLLSHSGYACLIPMKKPQLSLGNLVSICKSTRFNIWEHVTLKKTPLWERQV